ncbi:bifunctional pyr operon transcriptional regulator/uracil phosphoribosyltransferase PyrR [Desulfonatronospira sp.]|uniref:bifunctional pyr operon transcriptional regulator/uracil phosphoribosyltransferase PyrR n=1 Tax=Desulfonatronospira sp. TaxID=1962951 RepID=UPI0025B93505|nr:bifunctional pyr operon transcriptional regulator/uracil phosphoribosyltransferase PyrR [Desulfonatronospira sp.]
MASRIILNAKQMQKTMERLASQVWEQTADTDNLALMGIQRRGVDLAARMQKMLEEKTGQEIRLGKLDINLYRDDWTKMTSTPVINSTNIPFSVDGKTLILVDDVLYTGRTIRSALDALLDFGRPGCIKLLVLIDRGHRELPIHADFVGKKVNTSKNEQVDVELRERDGKDRVLLQEKGD